MSETLYLSYYDDPEGWVKIAEIDESEPYETDQTRIYKDTKAPREKYILATASGCSCWDGDWEVSRYSRLSTLLNDLFGDEHQYHPTFKGAEELKKQALAWKSGN